MASIMPFINLPRFFRRFACAININIKVNFSSILVGKNQSTCTFVHPKYALPVARVSTDHKYGDDRTEFNRVKMCMLAVGGIGLLNSSDINDGDDETGCEEDLGPTVLTERGAKRKAAGEYYYKMSHEIL